MQVELDGGEEHIGWTGSNAGLEGMHNAQGRFDMKVKSQAGNDLITMKHLPAVLCSSQRPFRVRATGRLIGDPPPLPLGDLTHTDS